MPKQKLAVGDLVRATGSIYMRLRDQRPKEEKNPCDEIALLDSVVKVQGGTLGIMLDPNSGTDVNGNQQADILWVIDGISIVTREIEWYVRKDVSRKNQTDT